MSTSEDQMALAVRAMAHHAGESWRTDRTGWTDDQWIKDAEALMNDLDGSVSSLVNGHVLALLRFWREHREGRVHNHPPYRPACNERDVAGQLRGACLNDDGTSLIPPASTEETS